MGQGCCKHNFNVDTITMNECHSDVEKNRHDLNNNCSTITSSLGQALDAIHCSKQDQLVINRLRTIEVVNILRMFNANSIVVGNTSRRRVLTKDSIQALYKPLISKLLYQGSDSNGGIEGSTAINMFNAFSRPKTADDKTSSGEDEKIKEHLDFNDFCFGISVCKYGARDERLLFLFHLFSNPVAKVLDDSKRLGDNHHVNDLQVLSVKHLKDLCRFCGLDSICIPRFETELTLNTFIDEVAERYIEDPVLENVFSQLELLPGKREERTAVMKSIQDNTTSSSTVSSGANGIRGSGKSGRMNNDSDGVVPPMDKERTDSTSKDEFCAEHEVAIEDLHVDTKCGYKAKPNGGIVKVSPMDKFETNDSDAHGGTKSSLIAAKKWNDASVLLSCCTQYAPGDLVYVIDSSWWWEWCCFVSICPVYDKSGLVVISLVEPLQPLNSTDSAPIRPGGIDNAQILHNSSWGGSGDETVLRDDVLSSTLHGSAMSDALKNGISTLSGSKASNTCIPCPLHACVVVSASTWSILYKLYGGSGPVLPRKVSSCLYPLTEDSDPTVWTPDSSDTGHLSIWNCCCNEIDIQVDLYPVLVKIVWCNSLGHPDSTYEQSVYIEKRCNTIDQLVAYTLQTHYGFVQLPSGYFGIDSDLSVDPDNKNAITDQSEDSVFTSSDINVWVLVYADEDANGLSNIYELLHGVHKNELPEAEGDPGTESESDDQGIDAVRKELWKDTEDSVVYGNSDMIGTVADMYDHVDLIRCATGRIQHSTNAVWLQIPREWRLGLSPDSDTSISGKRGCTLDSLSVSNGTKLMFESRFTRAVDIGVVSRAPMRVDADNVEKAKSSNNSCVELSIRTEGAECTTGSSCKSEKKHLCERISWPTERVCPAWDMVHFAKTTRVGSVVDIQTVKRNWLRALIIDKERVMYSTADSEDSTSPNHSSKPSYYRVYAKAEEIHRTSDGSEGKSTTDCEADEETEIVWSNSIEEIELNSYNCFKIAPLGWYTAPIAQFPALLVSRAMLSSVSIASELYGSLPNKGVEYSPGTGNTVLHQIESGFISVYRSITGSNHDHGFGGSGEHRSSASVMPNIIEMAYAPDSETVVSPTKEKNSVGSMSSTPITKQNTIHSNLTPGAIVVALSNEKQKREDERRQQQKQTKLQNEHTTPKGKENQFGLDFGRLANKFINRSKKKDNRRLTLASEMKTLGICGLTNMGNTCFMAAGLQCLAHTPLILIYFLSGRYKKELNRKNVLGTGGKLTEEYASLLQVLYNSGNSYTTPTKFKKVLSKFKEQFAGFEQQDCQEFLAEMLDCMHEDLNRVVNKPYTEAPSAEITAKMSDVEHATESWERHLARNSSIVVDMFQGQLKTVVRCPVCCKASRTFDPYMFLSVPIPQHNDKRVFVTVSHRLKRLGGSLTFTPVHSSAHASGEGSDSINTNGRVITMAPIDSNEELPYLSDCGYLVASSPHFSRYCIELPKSSTVGTIKREISILSSIPVTALVALDIHRSKILKIIEDTESVMSLPEGTNNINTAEAYYNYYGAATQGGEMLFEDSIYTHNGWGSSNSVCHLFLQETLKDLPFITCLDANRLNNRRAKLPEQKAEAEKKLVTTSEMDVGVGFTDRLEYSNGFVADEGDLVVDIDDYYSTIAEGDQSKKNDDEGVVSKTNVVVPPPPSANQENSNVNRSKFSIDSLQLHQRVDAMDHQKHWYAGNVMEFRYAKAKPSKNDAPVVEPDAMGKDSDQDMTEYYSNGRDRGGIYARIHFDSFSSKWDEWYLVSLLDSKCKSREQEQIDDDKIASVYTNTQRKLRIMELVVIQRQYNTASQDHACLEHTNTPFLLHCESFRSCEHSYRLLLEQAVKYMSNDDWNVYFEYVKAEQQKLQLNAKDIKNEWTDIWKNIVCSPVYSKYLPFRIRMLSQLEPLVDFSVKHQHKEHSHGMKPIRNAHELLTQLGDGCDMNVHAEINQHLLLSDRTKLEHIHWEGSLFPRDVSRPLSNIYHQKLLITIDWIPIVPFYCTPRFLSSNSMQSNIEEDVIVKNILWKHGNAKKVRYEEGLFKYINSEPSAGTETPERKKFFPVQKYRIPYKIYNAPYRFMVPVCYEHTSYINNIYKLRDQSQAIVDTHAANPRNLNMPPSASCKYNNILLFNAIQSVLSREKHEFYFIPLLASAEAISNASTSLFAGLLQTKSESDADGSLCTPLRLHNRHSNLTPTSCATQTPSTGAIVSSPVLNTPPASHLKYQNPLHHPNPLSIYKCLDSFTKEEVLEDDTWYCSQCKVHRKGIMQTSIYSLPDILIIHLKRFQMTSTWKQKISTKIQFPLNGLDLHAYVQSDGDDIDELGLDNKNKNDGAADTAIKSMEELFIQEQILMELQKKHQESEHLRKHSTSTRYNRDMYDLYAVANHIGNLSSGHYTAYVKCTCVQDDGQPMTSSVASVLDQLDNRIEMNAGIENANKASMTANRKTISSLLKELFVTTDADSSHSNDSMDSTLMNAANMIPEISSKWMYFDDQSVDEVPISIANTTNATVANELDKDSHHHGASTLTDRVVNEKAYVLFYKRRNLTNSNVINVVAS